MNLETAGSVDRLVLGLANQPCQRRDEFITEEMTNHLFQTPGFAFGMDLASLNIQRGRDHGLPPFVRWREPCGLSPIRTFEDLDKVMSPSTARKFRSLYSSVEDIDLFTAGLAERSVVGGLVGPTFACIIGQQFSNLRRGDRFWYENPESESSFTAGQLQQIRRATLAQVLCKTMDAVETIQPFVFLATDALKNRRVSCDDPAIGQLDLEFWAERSSRRVNHEPQVKTKRTVSDGSLVSRSKGSNARRKVNVNRPQEKISLPQKPFTSSIHQNNNIVVKRPIGRPDNVTIVVQNNAVNTPVFVNDGIYGSHVKIRQQPAAKPSSSFNQGASNYRPKPISTTIPHSGYPYVPQAYDDPSNPNPLAYGYRSPDEIFYEDYSPSSPRPTLYTYYTNIHPSTQAPNREVDGYLVNYGPPYRDSAHHERPTGHLYGSSAEQRPPQKPSYGDAKPTMNARPHYTSNDESYYKPGYDGVKPPTISRPSLGSIYGGSNAEPYGQTPDRPTLSSASNGDSYHALRPAYGGAAANYQSHVTQRPAGGSHNDNPSGEGYPVNSNKRPDQWNGYQKRPSERPAYDYDDPDAYQKRPHSGLYTSSGTNVASHHEDTSNSSPAYSQGPTASNNYDRYPDVTPAYQGRPTSAQSGWSDVSLYTKESNAPSEPFEPHSSSSFYQKPTTSRPAHHTGAGQSPNPYSKESADKPLHDGTNPYKNPGSPAGLSEEPPHSSSQQNRPYRPEVSTTDFHVRKQEAGLNARPIKVQSVTIVTEAIKTVHHPGQSGYISQYKVTSELPRPLAQRTKSNAPVTRKPGQYYYEKNVLHRYPGEVVEQIPKSNYYSADDAAEETPAQDRGLEPPSDGIVAETSADDSTERNESKSSTLAITDHGNNKDDVVDDLEGAFSAVVESVASADR